MEKRFTTDNGVSFEAKSVNLNPKSHEDNHSSNADELHNNPQNGLNSYNTIRPCHDFIKPNVTCVTTSKINKLEGNLHPTRTVLPNISLSCNLDGDNSVVNCGHLVGNKLDTCDDPILLLTPKHDQTAAWNYSRKGVCQTIPRLGIKGTDPNLHHCRKRLYKCQDETGCDNLCSDRNYKPNDGTQNNENSTRQQNDNVFILVGDRLPEKCGVTSSYYSDNKNTVNESQEKLETRQQTNKIQMNNKKIDDVITDNSKSKKQIKSTHLPLIKTRNFISDLTKETTKHLALPNSEVCFI